MNALPNVIAVVDDDETTHYLVAVMLKKQLPDVEIDSFLSAVEFLEGVKKGHRRPDAMLLDINMPKVSGWELMNELKILGLDTPVHMFSSSEDARDVSRVADYNFCKGYIVKPLTLEKVKQYIQDLQQTA
jgi:CheY-like chemotaxis protein